MNISEQPSISFEGVDIINVHFNSLQPFHLNEKISTNIDAKLIYEEGQDIFRIMMVADVESQDFFTLQVQALGHFKLNNIQNKEQSSNLINVNAPAIMFPYVRAFITSLTANCGEAVSTIVLPPQFFDGNLAPLED